MKRQKPKYLNPSVSGGKSLLIEKECLTKPLISGQLGILEFGKQLVESGDLDPVYLILWRAKFNPIKLRRWLLAFFCFYHCGTCSWIVDQPNYWAAMTEAANTSKHPRGTERRHYRGEAARKSMEYLRSRGVDGLFRGLEGELELAEAMSYVTEWVGFGKWIAFKVADMLERLEICRINFSATDTFLFESPREGAELVAENYGDRIAKEDAPRWALAYLGKRLGKLLAPPRYERTLNGQEYETILCKWKSHLNNHYPVGHDLEELRLGLMRYTGSRTAQTLLRELRCLEPKEKPTTLIVGS